MHPPGRKGALRIALKCQNIAQRRELTTIFRIGFQRGRGFIWGEQKDPREPPLLFFLMPELQNVEGKKNSRQTLMGRPDTHPKHTGTTPPTERRRAGPCIVEWG